MTRVQCSRCMLNLCGSCTISDFVVENDIDPINDDCSFFQVYRASITRWDKRTILRKAEVGGLSSEALTLMNRMKLADLRILFLKEGPTVLRGSYKDPSRRRHTKMYSLDWDALEKWSDNLEAET